MQDKINNNKQDAFSEWMKQKLENHQLPVDSGAWSAIEKQLPPKRKIIPWWMWLPVGSAAVLVLLFTLRPFIETPDYVAKSKSNAVTQHTEVAKQSAVQQSIAKADVSGNQIAKAPSVVLKQKQNLVQKSNIVIVDLPHIHSLMIDTSATVLNNAVETTTVQTVEKDQIAQVTVQQNDTVQTKAEMKKTVLDPNPDKCIAAISHIKSKGNNWMLAASYGSQSRSDFSSSNDVFASNDNRFALAKAPALYARVMEPDEFANKTYHDPISFGITIRKKLNKTLSMESGIMYTYLFSTFENGGVQRSDAKSHLHYVGIPMSLVTQLWAKSRWEVYLSAGGAAEKGLQSIYTQNVRTDYQTVTTTSKTKIDGLQWSVNAGLGVNYRIRKQMSIYFEPKVSRYFENDQPASARTDRPFVIGLNAGLRIGL